MSKRNKTGVYLETSLLKFPKKIFPKISGNTSYTNRPFYFNGIQIIIIIIKLE